MTIASNYTLRLTPDLRARIARTAKMDRRSLQSQILVLIEEALAARKGRTS